MLNPKDIVAYLDAADSDRHRQRLAYAAGLAQGWQAHLIAAFSPEDLALDPHMGFARGAAIKSLLASYEERRRQAEQSLRALIAEIQDRHGISVELRICEGEVGEPLMLHARHAAGAILGTGRRPGRQVSALTLSEDVIFASGRPSLLLPPAWPADRLPRRIVVGWNASREAARAISDAMPLLAAAAEVHVVVVPEPKIARLLGAMPGADISRHLARYGVPVALHRLEGADAGGLLLGHARAVDADLIVIGAYGQPRIAEFVFGSATQTLLANPDIPVLLSR